MRRALVLAVLTAFALAACGDDDDGSQADAAAVDAALPDAQGAPDAMDPCLDYCACMPVNCPTEYAQVLGDSEATCLQTCQALMTETATCRAYHCSLAVGAARAEHCPHAIGMMFCTQ